MKRPAAMTCAAIVISAVAALSACAPVKEEGAALRYRLREEPPSLDPFQPANDVTNPFLYLLFDGLVEYAPGSLDVRPAVAASWTVSPDGLTYTFHLREGVRFHNGRAVDADDVVWSIRRALSKKHGSGKGMFFEPLLGKPQFWDGTSDLLPGAAAPDPRTVVLTLRHPWAAFLTVLASEAGSIIPRENYDDDSKGYLRAPIGCGPYRLDSWETGMGIHLSRFNQHWKAVPAGGGIPGFDFIFQKDPTTALEDYKAGNIDFTPELPPGQREHIAATMPRDFHTGPRMSTMFVAMNHVTGPFAGNAALRRAVMHALDRDYIVDVLQEKKDEAARGFLPPGLSGFDPARPPIVHSMEEVARLLAKAGFPGGIGLPEVTYLTNETAGFRLLTDRILLDLTRVGLKVRIISMDFGAYQEAITAGRGTTPPADLFRLNWYADYPDTDNFLSPLFQTGADSNFGGYSSPALDALLKLAFTEKDHERRAELYRQADSLLMEDAAVAPLYWYGQDVLLKPAYSGLKLHPLGAFAIAWEEIAVSP